jgi:LysM repeat protein
MRGCVRWIVVAVSSLVALGLIGLCAFAALYMREQEQARVAFSPPTVLVTEPVAGALIPEGSYLSVSATAFGSIPVSRVELWLDGELRETQQSDRPEGRSTFSAYFDLPMPEGQHTLFVRAINTADLIGQSLPVAVVSTMRTPPEETFYAVPVEPEQTLANIAESYDTAPETLQELNPELGGQEPSPGTVLRVPKPPDEQEEPTTVGPQTAIGPQTPPPGNGAVPTPSVPPLPGLKVLPPGVVVAALIPFAGPPPQAPTNLQGQVDGCEVTLTWTDNATDETHYDVWMSLGMLMPQVVASLQSSPGTGPAWVKFFPGQEGYLTFWVEAANSEGAQPSNEITLLIPQNAGCGTVVTDYLQIQVFDMTLQGSYDKVYCYASYEAAPEKRIPSSAGDFVQVSAGKADFSQKAAGLSSRMVPVPTDGALNIEGKCLGWSGQTLNDIGPFSGTFTSSDWDGARRTLKSTSYDIEFAVKPYSVGVWSTLGVSAGMYGSEDPTLPTPYGVSMGNPFPPSGSPDPRERVLSWQWSGDPSKIKGFAVFLDGIPYDYFDGANTRQAKVYNPSYCGKSFLWQVRAVAGPTQSALSSPFYDKQPECKTYVMVTFDEISMLYSSDGLFGGDCDKLDAYFRLRVNDEERSFWGGCGCRSDFGGACSGLVACTCYGCWVMPLKCGTHAFESITPETPELPHPESFVVPVATDIDLNIGTQFWDNDDWSGDDAFGKHEAHHYWPSLQDAQDELGCGKTFTTQRASTGTATTVLRYSVYVYPNACRDVPPYGITQ